MSVPDELQPDGSSAVGAWRGLLIALTAFQALSAVAGGVAVMLFDGLGMPKSWLAGTPMTYPLAGSVLLVVVGGTQVLALVLLARRAPTGLLAASVAGFGMVIWILVELLIVPARTWLQAFYGATGLAQLALVLACFGVLAPITAARRRAVATAVPVDLPASGRP